MDEIIVIFNIVWLYFTMFFIRCIFYDVTTTHTEP
jgi:hypothetical protein